MGPIHLFSLLSSHSHFHRAFCPSFALPLRERDTNRLLVKCPASRLHRSRTGRYRQPWTRCSRACPATTSTRPTSPSGSRSSLRRVRERGRAWGAGGFWSRTVEWTISDCGVAGVDESKPFGVGLWCGRNSDWGVDDGPAVGEETVATSIDRLGYGRRMGHPVALLCAVCVALTNTGLWFRTIFLLLRFGDFAAWNSSECSTICRFHQCVTMTCIDSSCDGSSWIRTIQSRSAALSSAWASRSWYEPNNSEPETLGSMRAQ